MSDAQTNPLSWHCEFTYKNDARSRVWLARDEQGARWVIKMFKHASWRQRLGLWFGLHPGKREKQVHERLARAGVNVLPIECDGEQRVGVLGCHYWSMTRYVGMSAYHWVLYGMAADQPRERHILTRNLAKLAASLLCRGLVHADHKASNILLESGNVQKLRLIDAGSVRRRIRSSEAKNMFELLHANLHHAVVHSINPRKSKVTRTDRLRYWRTLCKAWPDAPRVLGDLSRTFEG